MPLFSALRAAYPEAAPALPSRYYFDISDGTLIRDEIGREIDTPLGLRREALRIITARAAAEADDAKECALQVAVRDETGTPRLAIRLVCQVEEV
jgi:hypothetical protein